MRATENAFVIAVGDLIGPDGGTRQEHIETPVEWHLEMSRVLADPPLETDLRLVGGPSGVLAKGSVSAVVRHTCDRCLDEWDEELDLSYAELFASGPDRDEDEYVIHGDEVDLEPMLRDAVLLALPLAPVCPGECAGPAAGLGGADDSDLNAGAPGSGERVNSPFAVLEGLFDPDEADGPGSGTT